MGARRSNVADPDQAPRPSKSGQVSSRVLLGIAVPGVVPSVLAYLHL
jgi:hypothetical protein